MIWNIKVWQTCKKIKNKEGGQHFFTPLYVSLQWEFVCGYDYSSPIRSSPNDPHKYTFFILFVHPETTIDHSLYSILNF